MSLLPTMRDTMTDKKLQTPVDINKCIEWVRQAGSIALEHYENPEMSLKGTQDYLSQADKQIENFLIEKLETNFLGHSILAEESGGNLGLSGFIIDPLDGTENFLRKIPMWGICLSFIENKKVTWGIIFNPVTDELFIGRRGQGATLNGKKLQVSKIRNLNESCVCLGHSYRTDNIHLHTMMGEFIKNKVSLRLGGSGAIGLAYVASGRYDAFIEEHLRIWDFIHASIMIEEAGGYFYPFDIDKAVKGGGVGVGINSELKNKILDIYESTKGKV